MSLSVTKGLLGWAGEEAALPLEADGLGLAEFASLDRFREITPRNLVSGTLDALTPEILRRKAGPRRPLSSTAWLDGLRGWAALTVCMVHLTVYTHNDIELCYNHVLPGAAGQSNNSPAALPIIRTVFTGGHFAVMLFFVISGYVITRKPLALLHEGRRDDFLEAINSAVVRRPLRLCLPVAGSTLLFACVWHVFGIAVPWPAKQPHLLAELVHWCQETSAFLFVFRLGLLFHRYNIHTWTIPVELRGSVFLFVWLFGLHQVPARARILLTAGMLLHLAVGSAGAWYAGFFAGMLTAELDLRGAAERGAPAAQISLPWDAALAALRRRRRLFAVLMHAMLLCGLLLAGQPSSDHLKSDELFGSCAGWSTLQRFIPAAYGEGEDGGANRWFWLFWAAWMTLVAVREIDWLRGIFECRLSQYLGRISFALYLLHGPLIGIFSERLFYLTGVKSPVFPDEVVRIGYLHNKWHDASWWPLPDGGPRGLEPNFLLCVALSIPLFLYAAELGTKMFDKPSVRVSQLAYKKLKQMR